MALKIFSAGAAQELIRQLSLLPGHAVRQEELECRFGAVGAVGEWATAAHAQGQACDVVIVTPSIVSRLAEDLRGALRMRGSLGTAVTGMVFRNDAPPAFNTATTELLVSTLLAASTVFVPDMQKSTGGRHACAVFRELGLEEKLLPRLREYPGGAEAVAALAASGDKNAMAFAQSTEVSAASAVRFAGGLPGQHYLETEYLVGLVDASRQASDFVDLITGASTLPLRQQCGFNPAHSPNTSIAS